MPRKADGYIVHLMLNGGHREEIEFTTIKEFQLWYSGELMPKHDSTDLITVPIRNISGEYMVIRPSSVVALRVEPIFYGSVERPEPEIDE